MGILNIFKGVRDAITAVTGAVVRGTTTVWDFVSGKRGAARPAPTATVNPPGQPAAVVQRQPAPVVQPMVNVTQPVAPVPGGAPVVSKVPPEWKTAIHVEPTVLRVGQPILGEQYQYQVQVWVTPPYNPKAGEPAPPAEEKWVTITSAEAKPLDEIAMEASQVAADAAERGRKGYGVTVVGVGSIVPVIYTEPRP